jgi:thiol-disulfide isomerase/thioredoxin
MKVTTYIFVLSVSAVELLSCKDTPGHGRIPADSTSKSKAHDVTFMLDGIDPNVKKHLSFYYHDAVAYGHPVYISRNNSSVTLDTPALFFRPNSEQTPFLIYPGEKITIRSVENDAIEMYIKGDPKRTNELNFFDKLVKQTGNIYYAFKFMPYHNQVGSVSDLEASATKINVVKNTRLKFLDSCIKKASISHSFAKLALSTIQSTALTDTLFLYFNNHDMLKKHQLYHKLLAEKISSIKHIEMVPLQIYYSTCLMLVSLNTGKPPLYLIHHKDELVQRFSFIEKHFSGKTRDFLMANTLYTAHNNAIPVPATLQNQFDKLCANSIYKDIVLHTFQEQESIKLLAGNNNLLSADGKSVMKLQSLIARHKGKLLFLDFWASWCGPCREEIPYMQRLEQQFKDDDIAFVSISTDKRTTEWLKAVKEESLINNENYQLLNSDQSDFVKQYKIYTIPRYLLIDRKGNIITDDAPRPSNPKLKALINKYL